MQELRRGAAAGIVLALIATLPVAAASDLEAEFRQACQALTTENDGNKMLIGEDRWVLLSSELHYAATPKLWGPDAAVANPRCKPELADPVPAIVDFHRQLEDRGIELYVVPVPIRELVYPESVLGRQRIPADERLPYLHSPQHELYEVLRSRGVRVVDLLPLLLDYRDDERAPLFCRSDPHWTGSGVALAAAELARLLSGSSWYAEVPRQPLAAEWQTMEHTGLLYREVEDPDGVLSEPDTVQLRPVTRESGEPLALRNPDSQLVIIGDSNTFWWKQRQAALPHQLAYELGFPVDLLSSSGGGATETRLNLIRTARSDPDYLAGKKAVIWCFTTRIFIMATEGWVPLPLPPTTESTSPDSVAPVE